ncbi:MAG: hypothetical protein WBF79_13955 [Rhodococcus sp. (in: high G+C Gram-positive bacteria)]
MLLVRNLGQISGVVGQRSEQLGRLFAELDRVIGAFGSDVDQLIASLKDVNEGQIPLLEVLEDLRGVYDSEYGPTDDAFRRLVPGAQQIVDLLALTPSLLGSIADQVRTSPEQQVYACAEGSTDIPGIGSVVLGTQQLVVCQ